MKKWIVTPAFCKASLLELNFKNFAKAPPKDFRHIVIDGHYPVDKEHNRQAIRALCDQYGAIYLNPGCDLGLHGNLNYAIEAMNIGKEDVFVGCDPDDFPQPGSLEKLADIIQSDRSIAVLALNFCLIKIRIQEGKVTKGYSGNHVVYSHPSVEMFKVAAFQMELIHQIPGKFNEPFKYYGGIESYLFYHWRQRKLHLAYIDEHCEELMIDRNDPTLFDKSYERWKCAHVGEGFTGSFETFITSGAV